jgi:hypothetical protein
LVRVSLLPARPSDRKAVAYNVHAADALGQFCAVWGRAKKQYLPVSVHQVQSCLRRSSINLDVDDHEGSSLGQLNRDVVPTVPAHATLPKVEDGPGQVEKLATQGLHGRFDAERPVSCDRHHPIGREL